MRADQVQLKLDELESLIESERRIFFRSSASEQQRLSARQAIKYYENRKIEIRNEFHNQLGDSDFETFEGDCTGRGNYS